jgi:hypothetical protein
MKSSIFLSEGALHFRTVRVMINAAAWVMFPKHRAFYAAGMRRGLHRPTPSRLGILLAASHDQRRLGRV